MSRIPSGCRPSFAAPLRYLCLALAVMLVGARAGAQAPAAGAICDRPGFPAPQLCRRAALDSARARFVVLLDGSGSMRSRWRSVTDALGNLSAAVPDGDELDVRLFAGDVRVLVNAAPASDAVRSSWQRSLTDLRSPTGASTDLGLAAESALDAIRDADTEQLQYVFFLTDGQHQPASTSRYSGSGAASAWADLARRAAALQRARPMHVVIIRLDAGAESERLSKVFEHAVVIDALTSGDLSRWFDRLSRQLAVEKLSALIQGELTRPLVTLRMGEDQRVHSGRSVKVRTTVEAPRQIVSTSIADTAAYPIASTGRIVFGAEPIPMTGEITVDWTGPHAPIWTAAWGGSQAVAETVTVRTTLGPREELDRLGIVRSDGTDRIIVEGSIAVRGALSDLVWWLAAAGLGIGLAVLIQRTRWALHRPRLSGTIIVKARTGNEAGMSHKLRDVAGTAFVVPDRNGQPVLSIEARSERGRTILVASPMVTDLAINGKPFSRHTELSTRLTFRSATAEISFIPS